SGSSDRPRAGGGEGRAEKKSESSSQNPESKGANPAATTTSWHPTPGKLMTRWAKDVSPDHPLPEYPRPQMVRKDWLNLNGLWQFAPAAEHATPPLGRNLERRILVPFPMESALSGVGERHERAWYRR